MTTRLPSMCHFCKHFYGLGFDSPHPPACNAFPNGIPDTILWEFVVDHRKNVPGDNGILFELTDGKTLPQYIIDSFAVERGASTESS